MKRYLFLVLGPLLALSLCACGEKDAGAGGSGPSAEESRTPTSESGSPKDNESLGGLTALADDDGPWFNEDASGCDLFARLGLTDVVPEGTTYIRRWMEDPWDEFLVRTSYTFEIPEPPSPEARQAYHNHILSQVRSAAEDGKAYVLRFEYDVEKNEGRNWWEEMEDYAAPMEDWDYIIYSYYYDGRLWDVTCNDEEFDDYYVWSLEITESTSEAKP